MTLRIRYRPEAEAELVDAARWYEERRAGLGETFVRAVDSASRFAAAWPLSGNPVPGQPDLRRVHVERFPYHVVYAAGGEVIEVLAVAHDRRRPAYWTAPSGL